MEHTFTQEITHTKGPAWGTQVTDEYGAPGVMPVPIMARVEPKFQRVVTSNGEDAQSSFQVFTCAEVRIGDTLGIEGLDHVVLNVATQRDLSGHDQFRQVVC